MSAEDSQANAIMQYSFLKVFANDRTIDEGELRFMERLALRDGSVDDKEREMLRAILNRVSESTVDPNTWTAVTRFRQRFGI